MFYIILAQWYYPTSPNIFQCVVRSKVSWSFKLCLMMQSELLMLVL